MVSFTGDFIVKLFFQFGSCGMDEFSSRFLLSVFFYDCRQLSIPVTFPFSNTTILPESYVHITLCVFSVISRGLPIAMLKML